MAFVEVKYHHIKDDNKSFFVNAKENYLCIVTVFIIGGLFFRANQLNITP